MRQRVIAKGALERNVTTVPPWAHDSAVHYDDTSRAAFREKHRLAGKFVVMYSGNHSPCHPLDTLMEAVIRFASCENLVFVFIGGGSEFKKIQRLGVERGLQNLRCLPYQPLDQLAGSLSAADLHVVVMGDPFVGIVHPCKVYNILRLGIPLLYVGPPQSHLTDLLPEWAEGLWSFVARHGDVDGVVCNVQRAMGNGLQRYESEMELSNGFSQEVLLGRMIGAIENGSKSAGDGAENIENRIYAER